MSYYCTKKVVVPTKFKTSVSGCKQNLTVQINAIKEKRPVLLLSCISQVVNLKVVGELVK